MDSRLGRVNQTTLPRFKSFRKKNLITSNSEAERSTQASGNVSSIKGKLSKGKPRSRSFVTTTIRGLKRMASMETFGNVNSSRSKKKSRNVRKLSHGSAAKSMVDLFKRGIRLDDIEDIEDEFEEDMPDFTRNEAEEHVQYRNSFFESMRFNKSDLSVELVSKLSETESLSDAETVETVLYSEGEGDKIEIYKEAKEEDTVKRLNDQLFNDSEIFVTSQKRKTKNKKKNTFKNKNIRKKKRKDKKLHIKDTI